MTGHDYEYVVADYLRSRGYHGVKVTKGSGDFGVDVIATKNGIKYAVQCKLYSSPVGVSAVQEVVAGKAYYGCKGAIVATNSTFTAAAEKLADMNDVILLDGITPNRSRSGITMKKVLLYLLWLGAVGGIITEILEPIDPTETLTTIILIPLLTLPFWIKAAIRLVKKLLTQRKSDTKSSADLNKVNLSTAAQTAPPAYQHTLPLSVSNLSIEELKDAAKVMVQAECTSIEGEIDEPDLIASAIALVVHERLCSVSLIQRRLKLGYMRASNVVDVLERLGVVGPFMGSIPRDILMTDKELLSKTNRPFS